jgi:Zn-dependent protease with chaperone function
MATRQPDSENSGPGPDRWPDLQPPPDFLTDFHGSKAGLFGTSVAAAAASTDGATAPPRTPVRPAPRTEPTRPAPKTEPTRPVAKGALAKRPAKRTVAGKKASATAKKAPRAAEAPPATRPVVAEEVIDTEEVPAELVHTEEAHTATKQTKPTRPKARHVQPKAEVKPTPPPAPVQPDPDDWGVGYLEAASEERAGVPDQYDDGVQWLIAGLRRVTWGSFLGVLLGWTGAWLAPWGAVIGMFAGILVAFGVFTSNSFGSSAFNNGLGQSVTLVSVITGGVLGIAAGFIGVLYFIFVANPLATVLAFISGALVSAVTVVITACFEHTSLRLRGYRRLSNDEARQVAPLVKDVAEAMNLPALPRFAIDDVVIPNAWSHMRTIVITKGLLQSLDDGEIRAILAHELQHWQSGDSVALHFVWAASLPIVLMYKFGVWMSGGIHALGGGAGKSIRTLLGFVGWIIAWPAGVMMNMVLIPVVRASQRQAEYDADAAAAAIGLAPQLISALQKLSAFEGSRTGWEQALSATHPPVELRIEALQPDRPDDWEYQEDDLTGPTWHEVRRIFGGLRGVAKR